jgi:hypothetical protein
MTINNVYTPKMRNNSINRNPLLIIEENPEATEEDKKFQRSIGKLTKRNKSQ